MGNLELVFVTVLAWFESLQLFLLGILERQCLQE